MLAIAVSCAAEPATELSGMDQLEQITQKAKSMEDFLNSPELIEEYYKVAEKYYGGRVNRDALKNIFSQIKTLRKEIPELEERLWTRQKGDPKFMDPWTIEASAKSSGREIKYQLFKQFLKDSKEQNQKIFDEIVKENGDQFKKIEKVQELSKHLESEIRSFNQKLDLSLDRKVLGKLKSEFFERLKSDPALKALGAYYANEVMNSESFREIVDTRDPDLILDFLHNDLRANFNSIREILPQLPEETHAQILQEVRDAIPRVSGNQLETIFPRVMTTSTKGSLYVLGSGSVNYVVKPYPKLFHRALASKILGECTAYDPMRYLAPAGDAHGRSFYWEKTDGETGKYLGFTDFVAGEMDGKRWVNPGFGSPELKKEIQIKGRGKREPMWKFYLDHVQKNKPSDWEGLVISGGSGADNARVLDSVRQDVRYRLGKKSNHEFKMNDPLVDRIRKISKAKGLYNGAKYDNGRGMVADATIVDARSLTYFAKPEDLTREYVVARAQEKLLSALDSEYEFGVSLLAQDELENEKEIPFRMMKNLRERPKIPYGNDPVINRYLGKYFESQYPGDLRESISTMMSPTHADHEVFTTYLKKNGVAGNLVWKEAMQGMVENGEQEPSRELNHLYFQDRFGLNDYELGAKTKPEERTLILENPTTKAEKRARSAMVSEPGFMNSFHKEPYRKVLMDPSDVDHARALQNLDSKLLDKDFKILNTDDYQKIIADENHPLRPALLEDPYKLTVEAQSSLIPILNGKNEIEKMALAKNPSFKKMFMEGTVYDDLVYSILSNVDHPAYSMVIDVANDRSSKFLGRPKGRPIDELMRANPRIEYDLNKNIDVRAFDRELDREWREGILSQERIHQIVMKEYLHPIRNRLLLSLAEKPERNGFTLEDLEIALKNPNEPNPSYLAHAIDHFRVSSSEVIHSENRGIPILKRILSDPNHPHLDGVSDHIRFNLESRAKDVRLSYEELKEAGWIDAYSRALRNIIRENASKTNEEIAEILVSRHLMTAFWLDFDQQTQLYAFQSEKTLERVRVILEATFNAGKGNQKLQIAIWQRLKESIVNKKDALTFNGRKMFAEILRGGPAPTVKNSYEQWLLEGIAAWSCTPEKMAQYERSAADCEKFLSKMKNLEFKIEPRPEFQHGVIGFGEPILKNGEGSCFWDKAKAIFGWKKRK